MKPKNGIERWELFFLNIITIWRFQQQFIYCCNLIDAAVFLFQAVHLRPDDPRAHTNLGAILHLLERPVQAAISYKEALQLQPNDPTTIANLAKLGISEVAWNGINWKHYQIYWNISKSNPVDCGINLFDKKTAVIILTDSTIPRII